MPEQDEVQFFFIERQAILHIEDFKQVILCNHTVQIDCGHRIGMYQIGAFLAGLEPVLSQNQHSRAYLVRHHIGDHAILEKCLQVAKFEEDGIDIYAVAMDLA